MIARIFGLVGGFLAMVVLLTVAVTNRHGVTLVLDPFMPENPVVSLVLPFYAYLFAMLILGILIGGLATWISQGKWRRLTRLRTQEAMRWRGEAERLTRERDANVGERKQLALAKR